jgi:hypothetical protein
MIIQFKIDQRIYYYDKILDFMICSFNDLPITVDNKIDKKELLKSLNINEALVLNWLTPHYIDLLLTYKILIFRNDCGGTIVLTEESIRLMSDTGIDISLDK